ncbi:MAG: primase protein [Parcubacteria group bacterium GW2011_GWC1_35_8]|uniref:DNA primase n=3 Tax=Candidatus Nomuraibacteriota TaxID=1752729 RepID=A0A1F6YTQ1_9BACT|nr:MAG: primase protein [Parcubacteria group bacterium GW2011_GWC1_35_8]KKP89838.1 MAG: primase protein [Candidatus Nomurabacteria bacterium GW2011_GWC2_35_8]OGJ06138.1 MAG: DNA primase [Candidatus Nomurabacteria bacterium RIFOXYA1_FULL_35_17]OGJ09725.1 MAG: DNA primase [Candidatus Nomurabacteria bacterium RIFOXYC2_FULL_36_19]OGJ14555.1 MAG: DNA primase [Candidatus Nomurabacteria bacterium RIFOXYD2_FULL_35_12]
MSSSVDQIKSRIDILTLVSSYMKLDRAGASWKGRCPFHNEKTPSFFVSPDRGSYYCFGCGASGDIFSFVEEFEGLDFKGALKLLADRAGVVLEVYTSEMKEKESEKEKLYRVMEEATKFFEDNFPPKADQPQAEKGKKDAWEYLKARGLTEKTIKDFRIGWAILDWRKLYDHLKMKGFADNEIEHAGLAKRPDKEAGKPDKAMYDRFRGRVMFPISDSSGRIIAFSGRLLESVPTPEGVGRPTESVGPKYLNSPETPIFNKSSVLFGIDKAKESIRKNNFSILVEGQMDLVLSHQAGFKNTVASSGTAMNDKVFSKENIINNLGLICRLSKNIVLAYDADKAGINASNRFAKIALSLGMDVKVASMKDGVDPADVISKEGKDVWREAIRNSKHFIPSMLERIIKDAKGDGRKVGIGIKERLLPFVNNLESSIEKSHFITFISNTSGIAEKALMEDLKKVESELKSETEETEIAKENVEKKMRKDPIERRLLGIAFWQEGVKDKIIEPELIFKKLNKVKEIYKDIKEDLIYEAEAFYSDSENLKKDVDEMLLSIEEEYLNEELVKMMMEIKTLKDGKQETEILKKISEINKRKEEIKNNKNRRNI